MASLSANAFPLKTIMASPFLQYDKLLGLSSDGGYVQSPALSQLSAVFLLSACLALRQQWFWQSPSYPISDSDYQLILEMIDECEGQLMLNLRIGSIVPSVALIGDPSYVVMVGQLLPVASYPELAPVVPPIWIVGTDIQLPDMRSTSLHGADTLPNLGTVAGENDVTLTVANIPSHNHTQNPHTHTYVGQSVTPTGAGPVVAGASLSVPLPSVTGVSTPSINNTGGDGSHNNVPQSLEVAWYIIAR